MEHKVTWQLPTAPDFYYDVEIESDAGIVFLMLTFPEVKAALEAIRNNEAHPPHIGRPSWWVDAEHGDTTLNIQVIGVSAIVRVTIPGDQVRGALEEIIEHATRQEGDTE